jgi:DNA-binding Lrp family transcriptional regulator
MDEKDKAILKLAQGDLGLVKQPFEEWARALGMSEAEVIERINDLKTQGIIRSFKAILRHSKAGIKANAMVVWAVPEERVDEVGSKLASFDAITHCYERPGFGEYNVFSMIHGKTRDEVISMIEKISKAIRIDAYKIFWSEKELKKTSMKYF